MKNSNNNGSKSFTAYGLKLTAGFTLIELLVVIGITLVLAAAVTPIYGNLQVSSQLNESTSGIIQTLRIARERSVARFNNLSHGVYFEINASSNDRFILYQGDSYSGRDDAYDRAVILDGVLFFSAEDFTLTGGKDVDVNFSKGLGMPDNTGTVTLTHDVSGTRTITVNSFGMVEED